MRGVSRPTEAQARSLEDALSAEDPLADQWVSFAADHLTPESSQRWVERAISQGIDQLYQPPKPLYALFQQLECVPLWLDDQLLSLARQTVRRSGPLGSWLLVNVALMGGYRYEGVIRPLLLTGRLSEYAPKRLADTTQFVQDVLSKDGLKYGQSGYRAIVRVRLLHAHIRYHLRHHPEWSHKDWGAPVNQADMIATLLLFSLSYLVTSRVIGLKFNEREALSVIHLWRYVGILLGIESHLIPATEEEARRMFYLVGMTQTLAGPEAASLGRALHEVPLNLAEGWLERWQARAAMSVRAGISRIFLGDEAMEHLGLPMSLTRYAILGAVPLIYSADRVRNIIPGATNLSTFLGGKWQDWHSKQLIEKSAHH